MNIDIDELEKRVEELEKNSHPPVDWKLKIYNLKNKLEKLYERVNKHIKE